MRGGILGLGKGRLSGATQVNGETIIIVSRGGALVKKRLLSGRRVVEDGIIGYQTDCYEFGHGKLTYDSEVSYEAKH